MSSMAELLQPAPAGTTVHLPAMLPTAIITQEMNTGMYISGVLAFLLWDMVLTLPAEIRMYHKRGFKWLITPPFLVARYSAPVCIGLYVNMVRSTSWTPERCFYLGRASVFLGAILTSSASMIFAVRTWAMWQRNRYILALVSILWAGQLAANLIICNWLRPKAIMMGMCTFVMPGHEVTWSYYTCNIIYDTIITLLAIASLFLDSHGISSLSDSRGTVQKVQQRLITDGLIYFIAALVVNLINALFFSRLWTYEDINGSLANAVTSICASRLVLLKLGGDFDFKVAFGGARSTPTPTPSTSAKLRTQELRASMPVQQSVSHVYPPPGPDLGMTVPYTVETQVVRAPHDRHDPYTPHPKAYSIGETDHGDAGIAGEHKHSPHDEEAIVGL